MPLHLHRTVFDLCSQHLGSGLVGLRGLFLRTAAVLWDGYCSLVLITGFSLINTRNLDLLQPTRT